MIGRTEADPKNHKDCKLEEGYFPCYGLCFNLCKTSEAVAYEAICPKCNIWTSFPDSKSLEVATFFECKKLGYGKRIKEGKVYEM